MPGENRLIPIEKGHLHNVSKTSGSVFLTAAIAPSFPPSIFRTMIVVSAATRFQANVTHDTVKKEVYFNTGSDLTADCMYTFDLLVITGDTINFEINDTATVLFRLVEIPVAI